MIEKKTEQGEELIERGIKEKKCSLTYHVDTSRVFQAAHPLQRCHPNSGPLENHTAIRGTQTHTNTHKHKHITKNQLTLISSLFTYRLHIGCTLIADETAVHSGRHDKPVRYGRGCARNLNPPCGLLAVVT